MNDPHVKALNYTVEHGDHIDYSNSVPFELDCCEYSIHIENSHAKFSFKSHFASIDEARACINPLIEVWELDAALRFGPRSLEFRYVNGDVIDRNPTPGTTVLNAEAGQMVATPGTVKLVVGMSAYPAPPMDMVRSPEVDRMFKRYANYRDGKSDLAATAYYCLTEVEDVHSGEKRKAAAKHLSIEFEVLSKIGELTTNKGGTEARKASGSAEYSPNERQWLAEAMRQLIKRAAKVAFDPNQILPQIKMDDLPML